MNLLGSETYRNELAECLSKVTDELVVLSAFVTRPGFQWLLNRTNNDRFTGNLVVRWRPDDLRSGASSLEVYAVAKEAGWNVYICPDLHAKSILIDKAMVFVGSANLTGCGLSIVPGANRELGVMFEASSRDIAVFEAILSESTLVTDSIVEKLKLFLDSCSEEEYGFSGSRWPAEIERIFEKPPAKLWVADMLWASPVTLFRDVGICSLSTKEAVHDLRILGLEDVEIIDTEILKKTFLSSRPWKWLFAQLSNAKNQELYFGALSSLLHQALLDDPSPYRKDVKCLLQNLFLWADFLDNKYVFIDVPRSKSQRMSLVEELSVCT